MQNGPVATGPFASKEDAVQDPGLTPTPDEQTPEEEPVPGEEPGVTPPEPDTLPEEPDVTEPEREGPIHDA
jgi:hypothetical protein